MPPEVWVLLFIFHILVLWSHGCRMQGWHPDPEASCQEWGRGKGTREAEGNGGTELSLFLSLEKVEGSSLAVQSLGLTAFTAVSWVQSIVRELRWPPIFFWSRVFPKTPPGEFLLIPCWPEVGHFTPLSCKETEKQGCPALFGPVKDTLLPQIKSEISSNKECGVDAGQTTITSATPEIHCQCLHVVPSTWECLRNVCLGDFRSTLVGRELNHASQK